MYRALILMFVLMVKVCFASNVSTETAKNVSTNVKLGKNSPNRDYDQSATAVGNCGDTQTYLDNVATCNAKGAKRLKNVANPAEQFCRLKFVMLTCQRDAFCQYCDPEEYQHYLTSHGGFNEQLSGLMNSDCAQWAKGAAPDAKCPSAIAYRAGGVKVVLIIVPVIILVIILIAVGVAVYFLYLAKK